MNILNLKRFFGLVFLTSLLGSCAINNNMMFKTPKDGSFKYDSIPMRPVEEYRISVDDKIKFNLSPNSGENIVEALSGTSEGQDIDVRKENYTTTWDEFIVKGDGTVEFPILGNVNIVGLTISQCQDTLEKLFKDQYKDPFIQVKITNQRCIIFPGNGSDAKILEIENNNTTLMEVLAMSGGIADRGKANMIKVMRKVNDKREIYLVDISTIKGVKYADMIIQGNDYIYIEPKPEIIIGALKEMAPVTSLISSVFMIYAILKKF